MSLGIGIKLSLSRQTMSYLWACMMTLAAVYFISGRILMWVAWGERSNVVGL